MSKIVEVLGVACVNERGVEAEDGALVVGFDNGAGRDEQAADNEKTCREMRKISAHTRSL